MASPQQKSALNIVLGTMSFGKPGGEGARVDNVQDIEAILACSSSMASRVDTARVYGRGTSEEMLGKINWQAKGLLMETKIVPFNNFLPDVSAAHTLEGLRKALMTSLKALNTDQLEIYYLHAPDRTVPYEVTLKAVDELYREGHFKRWGMSHYVAWEVAEIVGICKQHGYVLPSVYQGIYNAIHRDVEPELFPALRKFGIAFYEFNPLAGGLFTDRYTSIDTAAEKGSRLDPESIAGKAVYFDALAEVRGVVAAHGLTMVEVALRWHGDAILIGASSLAHTEENLVDLEKGPLPAEVLAALDAAWVTVKAYSSGYHSYPSLSKSS
ncbi:Aldo/keto reductase [Mycena galopus ATCC 62051]|nr:Aldo/keto reductase [Mycena galopus ATCC 62051]